MHLLFPVRKDLNSIQALHVSHSVHHRDGGIAFAVGDLLSTQQQNGMYSRWLTADQFAPFQRDQKLVEKINLIQPNILHFHGLWRSHTRVIRQLKHLQSCSVVAPHGMLDPWAVAHASWKKELVWSLWESQSLQNVGCLHALCEAEAVAIQRRLPNKPVAVIPNGVHLPSSKTLERHYLPWVNDIQSNANILLFFGRFHLKKGIEPLLTAWQSVIDFAEQSNWHLVLIGFGDDGKLQSQLNTFPIPRCHFYPPVFGLQKTAVLQHASAFVLPSYSEGLPVAALEAMAYRLPCLLSTACNLQAAFHANAALVAEPETSQLIPCLRSLFDLDVQQIESMGLNGFDLVRCQFGWSYACESTRHLYEWLLGHAKQPDFVKMDWSF